MIDHLVVGQFMGLLSGQIDHPGILAAARKSDIGHQRLSGAVDHTADDRQAERCCHVGKAVFQRGHCLDHVKPLSGAGRARDYGDAAMA